MSPLHNLPLPAGLGFLASKHECGAGLDSDSKLLRLCAAYHAAFARHKALLADYEANPTEDKWVAFGKGVGAALDIAQVAADVPAQTIEELAVKVGVAVHINQDMRSPGAKGWDGYDDYAGEITHSVLADAVRLLAGK